MPTLVTFNNFNLLYAGDRVAILFNLFKSFIFFCLLLFRLFFLPSSTPISATLATPVPLDFSALLPRHLPAACRSPVMPGLFLVTSFTGAAAVSQRASGRVFQRAGNRGWSILKPARLCRTCCDVTLGVTAGGPRPPLTDSEITLTTQYGLAASDWRTGTQKVVTLPPPLNIN